MSTIGIAKVLTSVVVVAGISAGSPFLHQWRLDSLTRKSGSGKATDTGIQISRGGQNLSLKNTDIFFSGERTKKELKLEQVNMTLGGYVIKRGDVLCSPKQNGNYFVIKGSEKSRRGLYEVVGHPNIRVLKCEEKSGITNTFKLEWPNKHLVNMSVSTISLETCSFVFEPQTTSSGWKIILRNCHSRTKWGERLDDLVLSQANYTLK